MVCEGVHYFSAEQVIAYTPCMFTSTIAYSREEVGEHLHEIHYKVVEGTGKGLYLCGGGQIDQV